MLTFKKHNIEKEMKFKLTFSLLILFLLTPLFSAEIRVGSFNVRGKSVKDSIQGNGWEKRLPAIVKLIELYDFDVLGMQEALQSQLQDLASHLNHYSYFGKPGASVSGAYTPVFYKKSKFSVLDSGFFWFSETDSISGLGWDAKHIRICNWGKFKNLETDSVFWVFNMHLDNKGRVAQYKSAELLLKKMNEVAAGEPVIAMGDFNFTPTHSGYKLITDSGFFDVYQAAETWLHKRGTLNLFNLSYGKNYRVDHIFVNKYFQVLYYTAVIDTYFDAEGIERIPSDHYPVLGVIRFR